jgi:hypothetical protein
MELHRLRCLINDIQEQTIDKVNFDTDIAIDKGYTSEEKQEAEQIIIHTPKQTPQYRDVRFAILRFCFGRQILPEILYIEEARIVYLFFPGQGKYFMVYEEQLSDKLTEIYADLFGVK